VSQPAAAPILSRPDGPKQPQATESRRKHFETFMPPPTKSSYGELVLQSNQFKGASAPTHDLVLRTRLDARHVAAGDYLYQTGDAFEGIYLLWTPERHADYLASAPLMQIELATVSEKRPLRFDRIIQGEMFGELELLLGGLDPGRAVRKTSARAVTSSLAIALPAKLLLSIVDIDRQIRDRLIRTASQRLYEALRQQWMRTTLQPDLQLADWLVEMALESGMAKGNSVRFKRRISQADIAADLGVSRETINRRLGEWERSGLIRTGAQSQQFEILDHQRVARLATLCSGLNRKALALAVSDIHLAIGAGDLVRARNIAFDMLKHFPASPQLLHSAALAATRSGNWSEAIEDLSRLGLNGQFDIAALRESVIRSLKNPFSVAQKEDGADDDDDDQAISNAPGGLKMKEVGQLVEDISALKAKVLKEQAFGAADPGEARQIAATSHETYDAIYRETRGYYAGINAASMAIVAGRPALAEKIARQVLAELPSPNTGYWPLATRAEALLILGDIEGACGSMSLAARAPDADDGKKASTIVQFRRLAPLLDVDTESLIGLLKQKTVCLIAGHLFRGSQMDFDRQQAEAARITEAARDLYRRHDVGYVYGALACGADILLAEAALELGIEFHAVLPFDTELFLETSVKMGDPPGHSGFWAARYNDVLQQATSLIVLSKSEPPRAAMDSFYLYAARHLGGCALQRSDNLQTTCRLVAVASEAPAFHLAATRAFVERWRSLGRQADVIPIDLPAVAARPGKDVPNPFRHCIFVRPSQPAKPAAINRLKSVTRDVPDVQYFATGDDELCFVVADIGGVIQAGMRLVELAAQSGLSCSVVCDFGQVLDAKLRIAQNLVSRLRAASLPAGLPHNRLLATDLSAMQLKYEYGEAI
jgi:CRP-like cAMP-binding protein